MTVPRSCVFVGSTNETQFLEDETGSRRFWCVRVGDTIDIERLTSWRDQLWAEAVAAYRAGERWWLDAEEDRAREVDAEQHGVEDPWTAPVVRWLTSHVRDEHTAEEILSGALDLPRKDHSRQACARLGRLLRASGWERRKHRPFRDGARLGPTWCWFRPASLSGEGGSDG